MTSAPHLHDASTRTDLIDWGVQPEAISGASHSSGKLVHKGPDNRPECGIWVCTPGRWRLAIPRDELCHFVSGQATYRSDNGETIEVGPGTVVMFPAGWTGECTVHETMRNIYILAEDEPKERIMTTPVWKNPLSITDLVDWGVIPTMIEGQSHTSGKLLHKGPEGRSECGLWVCTPGKWECHVTRDEFCHFLEGRCTYVHESGEVIEIEPDTAAFFPQDWKGVCTVHETIKKVYMIR
ncbi:hypothetical protein C7I84_20920 [Mesorhizobium ephedrae]|uniref:(S)-ureidoglycine aminohydrolase cupin domain-containing protein n=2 Tax=Kumtagia ephedrae TaxID=2116701 RepID=A0A2P7S1I0_9HYPH|nr:hypothetical protein C7I84_20920 [Mesorhizobium ephedrae]